MISRMVITALTVWAMLTSVPALASLGSAAHRLQVQIDPTAQSLVGQDLITVRPAGAAELNFTLSRRATIQKIEVSGRARNAIFENGRLTVPLTPPERTGSIDVLIAYRATFDDSVPQQPVNTDNPGYGVIATISERGGFLLPGAAWYPEMLNASGTYQLKVSAPKGWLAVTSGRLDRHLTEGIAGVSEWTITDPIEGLALSVGPFTVTTRQAGGFKASTYLLSDDPELAGAYLNATLDYLQFYSQKFGDYAFDQFVIVENFFQTGYGFPGYTLLGGRVLRLPFIIATSLGHEIAHCWWGNGVTVDYSQGNWSEALTTYVADYLYKEEQSPQEAQAYRLQILRNYASLVTLEADFPLTAFTSRRSPLTKVVGYDKGAMVFHMLRRLIGDEAFWGALSDVYQQRRFTKTAWRDLQSAFEMRAGRSMADFFKQWVYRTDAPQIRLSDVDLSRPVPNGSWNIKGFIVQEGAIFNFPLILRVATEEGSQNDHVVQVSGRRTRFEVSAIGAPKRILLDPDIDLMRRLHLSEIPPTVNSLKGASRITLLLSDRAPQTANTADTLMKSMGLSPENIGYLESGEPAELPPGDILVVGKPPLRGALGHVLSPVAMAPGAVELNQKIYAQPRDVFFGVFTHPEADKRVIAFYWPLGGDDSRAPRIITHYGKYSYLLFRGGRNLAKGTWPIENSPVEHRW